MTHDLLYFTSAWKCNRVANNFQLLQTFDKILMNKQRSKERVTINKQIIPLIGTYRPVIGTYRLHIGPYWPVLIIYRSNISYLQAKYANIGIYRPRSGPYTLCIRPLRPNIGLYKPYISSYRLLLVICMPRISYHILVIYRAHIIGS